MAATQVEDLINALRMAGERFLYGLSLVPEDRLAWAPAEGAKTPLQVAARMAGHVRFVTHLIRERSLPPDRSVFYAAPPTTREEARATVDEALQGMLAALSALEEADVEKPMQAPWGETLPIRRYLPFSLNSIAYFQGQLNYVQIAYGDTDPNIPPHWRPRTP
jgi:hypothetical protein